MNPLSISPLELLRAHLLWRRRFTESALTVLLVIVASGKRGAKVREIEALTNLSLNTISKSLTELAAMAAVVASFEPSPSGKGRVMRLHATVHAHSLLCLKPEEMESGVAA